MGTILWIKRGSDNFREPFCCLQPYKLFIYDYSYPNNTCFCNDIRLHWLNKESVLLILDLPFSDAVQVLKIIRDSFDRETLDVVVFSFAFDDSQIKELLRNEASAVVKGLNALFSVISQFGSKEPCPKVDFYHSNQPYYEFTNFYPSPFNFEGGDWKTVEHFFQAHKFRDREAFMDIRNAPTARIAFQLSRKHRLKMRYDWESELPLRARCSHQEFFKDKVMWIGLNEKFNNNAKLLNKLLSTGTSVLREHTGNDEYWGDGLGNGKGRNKLGKMLMALRDDFNSSQLYRIPHNPLSTYYYAPFKVNEIWWDSLDQFFRISKFHPKCKIFQHLIIFSSESEFNKNIHHTSWCSLCREWSLSYEKKEEAITKLFEGNRQLQLYLVNHECFVEERFRSDIAQIYLKLARSFRNGG